MEIDRVDLVADEAVVAAVSAAGEVSDREKCTRLLAQTVAKNVKFLSSPAADLTAILDLYIAGTVTRIIKSSRTDFLFFLVSFYFFLLSFSNPFTSSRSFLKASSDGNCSKALCKMDLLCAYSFLSLSLASLL